MDLIEIYGGRVLKGRVQAGGAKNSALPILFSTLLAPGKHTFFNIPKVKDIETACCLLKNFGCQISQRKNNSLIVKVPEKLKNFKAHYDLMRTMRAGVLCLGPLLTRFGKAEVSLPGGCAIGSRPVNWHIEGFKLMGAVLEIQKGYIYGKNNLPLKGGRISFKQPTVGGTQNLMMAAVLSQGCSVIENAAKEPEVEDLALYLSKMGADIQGAGSSVIKIKGVRFLTPPEKHKVIADRVEAATLLTAAAVTQGEVLVENCIPSHLTAVILKFKACGFKISSGENWLQLSSPSSFKPLKISTGPYPEFPTDVQAQFMALMSQAQGESLIEECIFENRFMHIPELERLGAKIIRSRRKAKVFGPSPLKGAYVTATDLRASSCLVLAGLSAKGRTVIRRVYHLDRGYENLEKKLSSLGADIKRIKE